MGLVLKHVERTAAGGFQYRRRVPKAVSSIIGKAMFKRKLGDTRGEALAAYPRYHAQIEREIAAAEKRLAQGEALRNGSASDHEAYAEALRQMKEMVASGFTRGDMESAAAMIVQSYPVDPETDAPIGSSDLDRHKINLLRRGPQKHKAPEPTLGDAKTFYLKERGGDEAPETVRRFEVATNRIVVLVKEALGHDPVLANITREDARTVRDYMLDRLTVTGKPIAPSSVARDLNGLNAIINFTAKEMPLPASFKNPFSGLSGGKKGAKNTENDNRDPFPENVVERRGIRTPLLG